MISKRSRDIVLIISSACLLLYACETASTIEDPTKNYFIKYYGGDGDQEGVDAVVGADGSIYLLGNSNATGSTTGKQLYMVKTDADGKLIWEKTFGGKFDEEAKDIELTTDGRLVVLANSKKGSAENDILLMTVTLEGIKIDSVLIGMKTISPSGAEANDDASSVSQTSDGFIVAGTTTSIASKGSGGFATEDIQDVLHLRFTNSLTIFDEASWTRTSGTIGTDGASKVYQVDPLIYYVFGYSNIDISTGSGITDFNFWVYKLGTTGVPSDNQMYPGDAGTDEKLTSVITSPVQSGEGFLLAGTSSSTSGTGNYNIYVNKLRKTLTFEESVDYQFKRPLTVALGTLESDKAKVSVYPSSSSGYFVLTNEKSTTTENSFFLTKIDNEGNFAWPIDNPQSLIFGGQRDDYIGAVAELPDGRIILTGTMAIGDEAQKKMALIKLNKDGKFLE
ncbi:MAG: hypothetical protein AABY93_07455 [Bacteroidota bacterium]